MRRKIALVLLTAILLTGCASAANAWSWNDFKIWDNQQVKEQAKAEVRVFTLQPLIQRGVNAINANSYDLALADLMGYNRVCVDIVDKNEAYTLIRSNGKISSEQGCINGEFSVQTTSGNLGVLVKGLEDNDSAVLERMFHNNGIIVPGMVQFHVVSKCLFSDLC